MDTQYLQQRRQTWYVRIAVPPSLRAAVGKQHLIKSTGTRSLSKARASRWGILAELKAELAAAQGQQGGSSTVHEALVWRANLEAARLQASEIYGEDDYTDVLMDQARERSAQIHAQDSARGKLFDGLATGTATPLTLHLETWLSQGGQNGAFPERTKGDHRRSLKALGGWLTKERIAPTLEAIDRRTAGRFTTEHLLTSGRAAATIGKVIWTFSTYWAWLRRRGILSENQRNPWADQAPPKGPIKEPLKTPRGPLPTQKW